jgi:multimeric flavodoxin WrbA
MSSAAKKAMILDGSGKDDNEAGLVLEALKNELKKNGIEASCHTLRDIKIAPCIGCLKCWTKTPGDCIIRDAQTEIYSDLARSDMLVLVTPVTFGGYSSELKKGMDRLIPVLLPFFRNYMGEMHHPVRYGSGWRLLGFGTMPEADDQKARIFKDLVERNSRNLHAPQQSSCIVLKGTNANEIGQMVANEVRKVNA